jgi:hypothetical protein
MIEHEGRPLVFEAGSYRVVLRCSCGGFSRVWTPTNEHARDLAVAELHAHQLIGTPSHVDLDIPADVLVP